MVGQACFVSISKPEARRQSRQWRFQIVRQGGIEVATDQNVGMLIREGRQVSVQKTETQCVLLSL